MEKTTEPDQIKTSDLSNLRQNSKPAFLLGTFTLAVAIAIFWLN